MRKFLAIIKLGSTFPELAAKRGDFEDWVIEGLGPVSVPVQTINPVQGEALPDYDCLAGVVVTGSHAMVTDRHSWSERTGQWLLGLLPREIPLFAICYGHQLLAHALGYPVADNPLGPEEGTVPLTLTPEAAGDPLFAGLPNPLWAQVSHQQSVLKLPSEAVLLARSAKEPHQAYRIGRCAWGVQFHPEFDTEIQLAYLRRGAEALDLAEEASDALAHQVRPTPEAASLLQRFGRLCAAYWG
ncbi:MAG: glutamine amidotransferase [Thermoguttaceae bacterium]|nr:glutamine amidotransferase [Thermoguttaceae bacterium]MDW8039719.1 glutamine amidotransferase [Thermoguttaceae bacterium]